MYFVLNVPVSMPRRSVLWRRFGRSFTNQQPLCRFAECDDNATSADFGRPLCALHHSLIEEMAHERRRFTVADVPAQYHGA